MRYSEKKQLQPQAQTYPIPDGYLYCKETGQYRSEQITAMGRTVIEFDARTGVYTNRFIPLQGKKVGAAPFIFGGCVLVLLALVFCAFQFGWFQAPAAGAVAPQQQAVVTPSHEADAPDASQVPENTTSQTDAPPQAQDSEQTVQPEATSAPAKPFEDRTGLEDDWDWYGHKSYPAGSVPNGKYVSENGLSFILLDRPINDESGDYTTLLRIACLDKSGELEYDYTFDDMAVVSEGDKFTVSGEDGKINITLMKASESDIIVTLQDEQNDSNTIFQNKRFRRVFSPDE